MPEDELPTGRDRLLDAIRHPRRSQAVVAALLAVVGFMAAVQVRSTTQDSTYEGYREQDLIAVLSGLADATTRAEAELTRLEQARDDLLSASDAQEAALDQARTRLQALDVLAGVVPVTGPGIRLTITEETGTVSAQTMVDLVQELRTAGAEAIQVNGQVRLVAQSWFADVPGGLSVDGTTLSSPYVVDAIGNPEGLAGAVNFLEGPRAQLQDAGAVVDLETETALDIESTRKAEASQVATPAPDAE